MVAPDIRSQQFQKLMKLSIRWSSLLPYCYSSATKGGEHGRQVLCDQALAEVNK